MVLATARAGRRARVTAVAPAALPLDVLESKLRIPVLRPGVSRKSLVNRLRAERSVRLTTVVAAPGYGKSTLLAEWALRDERPFAWVSLDERDNDPIILLRHLAAAFDRVDPLDPRVLDALAEPGRSVWSTLAPRLTRAVASSRPFVAVLDDAHVLGPGDSAEIVSALAAHVPDGSMLVLAARTDPPLPLARLRARDELLELRTADLAFSRREAKLLLQTSRLEPDAGALTALVADTEGWAAGLHLSALENGDGCHGTDRFVADYFRSECLSQLSPERLAFLRRTSVLERLCGPLCDALLKAKDSALALEELERANMFIVPLDREGGWYRYHRLFRDLLQRELELHDPELVPELHRRAADWLERHGDLEAALDHAGASGDAGRAEELLAEVAWPAYHDGRIAAVEGWLERFEAHAPLDAHPGVAALGGWIYALDGRAPDAQRWLAAAGTSGPVPALLRAAMCADGVERMAADVDGAVKKLPDDSPLLATALLLQGAAALLRGETDLAESAFAAAGDRAGATDTSLVAIAERSLLAGEAGDHAGAERLALEARDLLATSPVADYPTTAIVRAAAARALLRHGRWDDARGELVAAERLSERLTHALPWYAVQTRLALGGAYVTLRDRAGALAQLAGIERILAVRPELGVLAERVADLRLGIEELAASRADTSGLTRAELRLLPLLATHLSFREIGDRLFVSRNTVKTQAISAYRKLGVSSRSAAIERAAELGLVDDRAAVAGDR